ncbi:MAG TPA: PepSY domain-containing protein [Xanthomonadaceae bacterium]|nr:PepSY domain-containing protein [Xanthomonadaceae bacterium]
MRSIRASALAALFFTPAAFGTGLATCESGPQSGWQPVDALESRLVTDGWQVRMIKEDGGCYEVYAIDEQGKRVEAYFHPVTLERVPIEDEH